MVRHKQENLTDKGRQGQAEMPHLAAAHNKVPWECASLRSGFPACPGAQPILRFPMLKHDKGLNQVGHSTGQTPILK